MKVFSIDVIVLFGIVTCVYGGEEVSIRKKRVGPDDNVYTIVRVPRDDWITNLNIKSYWVPFHDHEPIICTNFGNVTARCDCLWGTGESSWYDQIASKDLQPGETAEISCYGETPFYATGMKVRNYGVYLAFLWGARGAVPMGPESYNDDGKYEYKPEAIGYSINMLNFVNLGVDLVVSDALVDIFQDLFFSTTEESSVWEDVKDNVKRDLDVAKVEVITAMVTNDIKPIKHRIQDLKNNMDDPDIRRLYLNLADLLDGYDMKFIFEHSSDFENSRINMGILNVYSELINMQINFYVIGISSQKELKLKESDVKRLNRYLKGIVPRAVKHIENVLENRLKSILFEENVYDFYNLLMKARTTAELCGRAYYYDWYKAALPEKLPKDENRTALVYSKYHGAASPNLFKQALTYFGAPPLTPRMTGPLTRSQWSAFRVWKCWDVNTCGIELWFDNGDYHSLGVLTDSPKVKEEINADRRVVSITASAQSRAIRGLTFTFSNKDQVRYGYAFDSIPYVFKKRNYYVASLFVATDLPASGNIIQNIAVSYQMDPNAYKEDGTIQTNIRDRLKNSDENSSKSE